MNKEKLERFIASAKHLDKIQIFAVAKRSQTLLVQISWNRNKSILVNDREFDTIRAARRYAGYVLAIYLDKSHKRSALLSVVAVSLRRVESAAQFVVRSQDVGGFPEARDISALALTGDPPRINTSTGEMLGLDNIYFVDGKQDAVYGYNSAKKLFDAAPYNQQEKVVGKMRRYVRGPTPLPLPLPQPSPSPLPPPPPPLPEPEIVEALQPTPEPSPAAVNIVVEALPNIDFSQFSNGIPSCRDDCQVCVMLKKSRIQRAMATRLERIKRGEEMYDGKLRHGEVTKSPIAFQALFFSPSQDRTGADRQPVPGYEFLVNKFISSRTGSLFDFDDVMKRHKKETGRPYRFHYISHFTAYNHTPNKTNNRSYNRLVAGYDDTVGSGILARLRRVFRF